MNEVDARFTARRFISNVRLPSGMPDMQLYAAAANARIRYEKLDDGESGFTVPKGSNFVITVNSSESEERKRFTICHEIAHIVLKLSTKHSELPSWAYVKRDLNELWCDIFASELLMPHESFLKKIPGDDPAVEVIETLAEEFGASFPATASRYANLVSFPCAYVYMDGDFVRYAAPNGALRRKGIKIEMKCALPVGSIAQRLRSARQWATLTESVAQDIWFMNCDPGTDLWELARHYDKFDQTISLLWCSEDELPQGEVDRFNKRVDEDENGGMKELDGVISWENNGPRLKK